MFMFLDHLTLYTFWKLTGTSVLGFDVVGNLTTLIDSLVNGGFIGLVAFVILASFFTNGK